MIGPDQRSVLTEALTPPAGYDFDSGLATTYSLDLVTLLGLPLHLVWLAGNVQADDGGIDPLATLEALRRTAARLTVFCDRGRMAVPRAASTLLGLLEPVVHEVESPHGGAFHPKVWLLRFLNRSNGDVRITLLVLSRNITEDGSWDVSLRLDGMPGSRRDRRNEPLCRLFETCIERSRKPLDAARLAAATALKEDAARCNWKLPGDFGSLVFHAIGIGRRQEAWLPSLESGGDWDEIGVVSPFVTAGALAQLARIAKSKAYVVSRAEELAKCGAAALASFPRYLVMEESVLTTDSEDDAVGRMRGLHAKVFVASRGARTHLFVGSANATTAALSGTNVEFVVELQGPRRHVGGPADLVGDDGIGPLLREYVPDESEAAVTDADEDRLEALRDALCAAPLRLECVAQGPSWTMRLLGAEGVDLGDAKATAWSATDRADRGVPLAGDCVVLGSFAKQELTCLTAFRLALRERELCFVLNLPAAGLPPDRDHEILKAALRNRAAFMRYLLLLLGDLAQLGGAGGKQRRRGKAVGASAADDLPLFEMLAQSLADDPQRLRHVRQAVDGLRGGEEGDEVFPDGFLDLWQPFEQVMDEEEAGEAK
jgi:hypothetical protein